MEDVSSSDNHAVEHLFDQLNACFYSMCQRFDAIDIVDWTTFDISVQMDHLSHLQGISAQLFQQLESIQHKLELPYRLELNPTRMTDLEFSLERLFLRARLRSWHQQQKHSHKTARQVFPTLFLT